MQEKEKKCVVYRDDSIIIIDTRKPHDSQWAMNTYDYTELQLLFWDRYQGILKITSQTQILQCVQRHINALATNSPKNRNTNL